MNKKQVFLYALTSLFTISYVYTSVPITSNIVSVNNKPVSIQKSASSLPITSGIATVDGKPAQFARTSRLARAQQAPVQSFKPATTARLIIKDATGQRIGTYNPSEHKAIIKNPAKSDQTLYYTVTTTQNVKDSTPVTSLAGIHLGTITQNGNTMNIYGDLQHKASGKPHMVGGKGSTLHHKPLGNPHHANLSGATLQTKGMYDLHTFLAKSGKYDSYSKTATVEYPNGIAVNYEDVVEYNKSVTPPGYGLVPFAQIPTKTLEPDATIGGMGGLMETTTLYGKVSSHHHSAIHTPSDQPHMIGGAGGVYHGAQHTVDTAAKLPAYTMPGLAVGASPSK